MPRRYVLALLVLVALAVALGAAHAVTVVHAQTLGHVLADGCYPPVESPVVV